ncbi:MAG TPA: hypothetical protein VF559_03290 [Caulobacteraceae bacterium]|jgi:hypothetical protein
MAQLMSASRLSSLVTEALRTDKDAAVWLSGSGEVLFGRFPSPTARLDFGNERLERVAVSSKPSPITPATPDEGGRKTGDFAISVRGQSYGYPNLRQLLAGALRLLEDMSPGTLERLENHKPRSKRVVARKKDALYDNPKLVEKFSIELKPGWYMSTNNSAAEVKRYLELAASHAGLKPGEYSIRM